MRDYEASPVTIFDLATLNRAVMRDYEASPVTIFDLATLNRAVMRRK